MIHAQFNFLKNPRSSADMFPRVPREQVAADVRRRVVRLVISAATVYSRGVLGVFPWSVFGSGLSGLGLGALQR